MRNRGSLNVFACYAIWGVLPLFWQYLNKVSSVGVLGYRIMFCLVFMLVYLPCIGRWKDALALLRDKREMLWLAGASLGITVNWGTFIVAVTGGHVLDSSLAYYMYPILSVFVGAVFFREKLCGLQWVAIGMMAAGVIITAVRHGQFPWLALMIGGSFVLYGIMKRNVRCSAELSFFAESLIAAPLGILLIVLCEWKGVGALGNLSGAQWLLLPAAGVVTAVPLLFFARGIRETSNTLSGILMLINPTLQLVVGIFLMAEKFTETHIILFAFIWGGLVLFLAGRKGSDAKSRQMTDCGANTSSIEPKGE